LIQASLKYFEKSSEVLIEMGFVQCPFHKPLFCKWFTSTRIGIIWQHVDDRLAGFSDIEDLKWTAKQLGDRLGSEVEDTASILGHDNKYDRLAGRMELSCLTKINDFIASENLTQLATHDVPMTKTIFETMTKANCPETTEERDDAREIAGQYRQYAGLFGYTAQVVHVDCKNAARIFSKFMSNPDRLHHKAILYAIGYLIGRKGEFMLYVRAENFNGWSRILVFFDADLGGVHN
jgi:hypothetical protein